MMTAFL